MVYEISRFSLKIIHSKQCVTCYLFQIESFKIHLLIISQWRIEDFIGKKNVKKQLQQQQKQKWLIEAFGYRVIVIEKFYY